MKKTISLKTNKIIGELTELFPDYVFNVKYKEHYIERFIFTILAKLKEKTEVATKEELFKILEIFSFNVERNTEDFNSIVSVEYSLFEEIKDTLIYNINPDYLKERIQKKYDIEEEALLIMISIMEKYKNKLFSKEIEFEINYFNLGTIKYSHAYYYVDKKTKLLRNLRLNKTKIDKEKREKIFEEIFLPFSTHKNEYYRILWELKQFVDDKFIFSHFFEKKGERKNIIINIEKSYKENDNIYFFVQKKEVYSYQEELNDFIILNVEHIDIEEFEKLKKMAERKKENYKIMKEFILNIEI